MNINFSNTNNKKYIIFCSSSNDEGYYAGPNLGLEGSPRYALTFSWDKVLEITKELRLNNQFACFVSEWNQC